MKPIAVIDAASCLGLRPTGVEHAPAALRQAGLVKKLDAHDAGCIVPPTYNPTPDQSTRLLNLEGIREFSIELADQVEEAVRQKIFPLVLGGDCSLTLGCLLGLRRLPGRYGLAYLDGHESFHSVQSSGSGEVADMDLALITGHHGPARLTNLEDKQPLVRAEDVVLIGSRDHGEAHACGSPDINQTNVLVLNLTNLQRHGVNPSARLVSRHLTKPELYGYWIHLDVDVLSFQAMPAVDYPLGGGGLRMLELQRLLHVLLSSPRATGMDITIYNPNCDPKQKLAHQLVDCLAASFKQ